MTMVSQSKEVQEKKKKKDEKNIGVKLDIQLL